MHITIESSLLQALTPLGYFAGGGLIIWLGVVGLFLATRPYTEIGVIASQTIYGGWLHVGFGGAILYAIVVGFYLSPAFWWAEAATLLTVGITFWLWWHSATWLEQALERARARQ